MNAAASGLTCGWLVERAFNNLKQWRGLAARYVNHVLIYRGGMVLANIVLWLNA